MRFFRGILPIITVTIMMMFMAVSASAETTQEKLDRAKKEKEQTQQVINETKDNINQLEGTKKGLQGELNSLNQNLEEVSDRLENLENDIAGKKNDIELTQQELDLATETMNTQYDNMKKRLKFIYERADSAYLELLINSKGIGDFLNKALYIEAISDYDHRMLEQYRETRALVEEEKEKLIKQKEELDRLHEQQEQEKGKVEELVKSTSNSIAGYADKISEAEQEALKYEALAKAQEANIAALQKQLAEEMAMSRLAAKSAWRDISEVTFDEGDRYLLANLIYCEAGGEPYAGKLAVGAVVINRLLSSVYPNSVVGVIYQRKQFSPVGSGRLAIALANNKATDACYQAADEAMKGQTNVGNCLYFRTPVPGLNGIPIGGHIFY